MNGIEANHLDKYNTQDNRRPKNIPEIRMSNASTAVQSKQEQKQAKSLSPIVNKNIKVNTNRAPTDEDARDEFGISNRLNIAIKKKYTVSEVIGNGSYGTVSKATCKNTGKPVALKIMKNQPKMEYEIIKLVRELKLMSRLNKINEEFFEGKNCFVPKLIDIICPEPRSNLRKSEANSLAGVNLSQVCIVMEYIDTDLDQLMKHQIGFTEHHLVKVVYNCLLAISFVHLSNVMHRDIKPANILLNSHCSVKICDFGLARSMPESCTTEPNAMSTVILRKLTQNQPNQDAAISRILLDDRPRRKN